MTTNKSRTKSKYYMLLMMLAVVIVAMIWFFINQYTNRFQTTLNEEMQTYMVEIAQQVTLVMNERVDNNLLHLQSEAMTIEAMGERSPEYFATYLEDETQRFGYTQMSLANTDGISINNSGETYNVSNRQHYLLALRGEATISGVIAVGAGGADGIEYVVPVFDRGVVVGALMAGYTLDTFRDILKVNMFGQQGNAVVVDKQGIAVVNNGTDDSYNFFHTLKNGQSITAEDSKQFIADITAGDSGVINYTKDNIHYMMYYQPLGINDWSVLISVPTDVVTYKTKMFLTGIVYISGAVSLLIAALMLVLVCVQYRNRVYLEKILFVDTVTGGATQAKFELDANKLIAAQENGSYALVQMNLQKFKLINTTFGREAGDKTLRHIYHKIVEQLAEDELAARLSADKFGILLRFNSKEEFAIRFAELATDINSFNDDIKNKYILQFEQGVCLVNEIGIQFEVLFERANFARQHGDKQQFAQNTIAFYDDVERSVVMREKEIENCMEQALKDGQFEMYLQPKYELEHDTIGGAEALVRWNNSESGMIFPNDFIPLFERNGFIVKIDLYMFTQVCKLQQMWKDTGVTPVPISVNLSRVHLNDPNFLERYKEIFSRFDFPANLVEIEITESTVFEDVEQLCDVIIKAQEIGFTCSLDDFGSGYSSLNVLKDIPVDTLKLDRAFFYSKSEDDAKSRYVVENMVDLAGKLNMNTVAEGIETVKMVEYLRAVKCDMVQGYVFARPMPVEQFEQLLQKERDK